MYTNDFSWAKNVNFDYLSLYLFVFLHLNSPKFDILIVNTNFHTNIMNVFLFTNSHAMMTNPSRERVNNIGKIFI